MHWITDVSYLDGYKLKLKFEKNVYKVVDLQPHLEGKIFEPLKSISYFKSVTLNRDIDTITWPNNADFSPDFLYEIGQPVAELRGQALKTENKRFRNEAYTLIEVIIVVVILAILASLGIPQYTRTMERGKSDEAMANLKAIRTAQRIYRVDTLSWSNNISTLTVSNLLDSNLRGTTGATCANLTGTPSCNDANFNGYCYGAECPNAGDCAVAGVAANPLARAYRCRGGTYQGCNYEMKVDGSVIRSTTTANDPCPTVPNIF